MVRPFLDRQNVLKVSVELVPSSLRSGSSASSSSEGSASGGSDASAASEAGRGRGGKRRAADAASSEEGSAPSSALAAERAEPAPLLVGKDSDTRALARAVGWEAMSRMPSLSERKAAEGQQLQREGEGNGGGASGAQLVTLRMAYGEALLRGITAVAMAQSRVAHEMGVRLVAVPRLVKVQEGGRTFAVVELGLSQQQAEGPATQGSEEERRDGQAAAAGSKAKPSRSKAKADRS